MPKALKKHVSMLLTGLIALLVVGVVTAAPVLAAVDPCEINNPSPQTLEKCVEKNPIIKDLQTIVNFLSVGVGVVVVAFIIIGGIQYIMAGDNPAAVQAAKKKIMNALFGLLAFIFTYAFLNWLIPGGVF